MRDKRGWICAAVRGGAMSAGVIAVLMAATGCTWQPQVLTRAEVIGIWSGHGATLRFEADGTFVVTGLPEDGEGTPECSGTGEWWLGPDDAPSDTLSTNVCEGNPWTFIGSKEHPQMRRGVGDPDDGEDQTLSREEGSLPAQPDRPAPDSQPTRRTPDPEPPLPSPIHGSPGPHSRSGS